MAIISEISKMDHYVQIVKFTNVKGALNENSRTQTSVKSVWASLRVKSITEDVEEKVFSVDRRDYVIHYDDDVVAETIQDLAIIDGGKTYYVNGYNDEFAGRKMFILLNCEYRG